MIADRQTHTETDRQTRSSQYSALAYRGGVISKLKLEEMKRQEQLELRAVH